ncbi:unnamed protein product [Paramecium pentaurelia]|uniref:Uncharacterized protein n=1 Tax=Paramecium pentaurelia TaxID=43138 RepID=A0A8S1XHH6_9CILI|nr:unnamed protein product [Paramecium pentaurelia]
MISQHTLPYKLKSGEEKKDREAIVKRMVECWLDKKVKNESREYLEELIKIYEITTEEDSKWAKYKILRAPLIIEPKIESSRKVNGQIFQILKKKDI